MQVVLIEFNACLWSPLHGFGSCCADYVLDICVTLLCIEHWKGFDLLSTWTSIMIPSGVTQYEVHQQGHIQGLSHINHIPPLIWIKILEASWPTAFNHFDVALKRASLLVHAPDPLLMPGTLWGCLCLLVEASQSELVWQMWRTLVKYSCTSGSPTIERELSFHCVHSPRILSHTFVCARILLLEIWDFQNAAGFPRVHFPGERHAINPPPVYGWDRAARTDTISISLKDLPHNRDF